MKKLFLISLAAAGMLATSCQDYDPWDGDVAKYEYRKDFLNTFGNIDPNHTWNTAEQRTMEFKINVPGTFNLRIFTTNPKNADSQSELLANYTNNGQGYASGDSYTISFDCPAGLHKVWADIQYVGSQRHIIQQVELDAEGCGKAIFGEDGTRATIHPATTDHLKISKGDKEIFSKRAYTGTKNFMSVIPENVENTSKEDVHTDFVYVSTGELYHLYPVYIYTGAHVKVGVQCRQDEESEWEEEILMVDTQPTLLNGGIGDRITRLFSAEAPSGKPIRTAIDNATLGVPADFNWTISNYDGNGTNATATFFDYGHPSTSSNAKYATLYDETNAPNFVGTLCDEIILNVPKGWEFRFWVQQDLNDGRSLKRYSDRESNPDKKVYFGTFNNEHKHKDPKTGQDQNVLYLGVEDWNNTVHDINDIVFAFVGSIPTIVDEGGPHYLDAEYVIAYEDMGLNDFDFNDIVLSVQHVAGENTASVNILACGGTLPVYLGFDDSGDTNEKVCNSATNALKLFDGKELHEALSGKQNSYSEPMNVDGENNRVVNRSELRYAPKQYTMNDVPTTFSIVDKAQYFKLKVVQRPENGIEESNATAEITTPSIGSTNETPQAFVVSYTNWEWPTERTTINLVYEDFDAWLSKHDGVDGAKWYKPIWSGLDDASSNVDYSTTLRPSYSFDICLRTRDQIGDNLSVTIPKADFEAHGLTESTSLVMAFVVTNRQVGKSPTVTVYKNEATEANKLGNTLTFSDVSTTSTTSSYGDADKVSIEIANWSDVNSIIVVFNNDGDPNCKLNSIWAADADKNIHMLDYEDLLGYTEVGYDHGDGSQCNLDADGNCTNSAHHVTNTVEGKLAKVEDQIEVAIVNSSTTRPNFLVCNGAPILHQHSIASMASNAQAIATSATNANAYKARFILTVTAIENGCPIVSIKSKDQDQWLEANGGSARWSNSQVTTFKICRAIGGSRTSCIPGWNDDDMFRFQAVGTNNYLNADGPKFFSGNGEWSLWYMFEILP